MHGSIELRPCPATKTVGHTIEELSDSACHGRIGLLARYAPGLETSFVVDVAGVRSLQPDVVRLAARDQGEGLGGTEAGIQFQLARPITTWLAWRADVGPLGTVAATKSACRR